MAEMRYSTGEAARELGVSRDSLIAALRYGAPDASERIGGRRAFSDRDLERLRGWYRSREKGRGDED